MSYPQPRSLNADLHKGMTDGTTHDDTPNRGGDVSAPTAPDYRAARHLNAVH